ncbi:ArsS family sensor histidine kinase [Sulfurovum sp. zt1-1]|uniref:histidine kinase n=1 Tax=Sulfurovum zhangzhouensis TaxID=3019067 RepID=A0ABT7QX90_9BACT|nr:ArsS family sensor histidine kinase [Sulfurovum zhangzhouensis]MDM5271366.1 ArsS family sensor histidine kinase [Sulfurovum zhangzhouensis]
MRNLSVTTFIHILFSIAIIILVTTFILFLSWDRDRQKIEEFKHYQLISVTFLSNLQRHPGDERLQELYKELQLKPLSDEGASILKKRIENSGETIFTGGSALGKVRVFDIKGKRYIYIQRMEYNLMLVDDREEKYYFEIAVSLGVFLTVLLLLLYVAVLRKLYPLRTLHKEIQRFAKGDLNTKVTYKYDDEIGKIAQSFDNAIRHINQLSASKNLFMRNIMHELKTPITKGRIIVEMLEDVQSKKVLVRAFERMNELINELAQIERVTTQSFEPSLEYTSLKEVVQRTRELLINESDHMSIEVKDVALITDVNLLALALKNLMDNGIKYSTDKHVHLKSIDCGLEVSSRGKALQHPLSYYIEPFSQEEKRSSGFGLGLYIVNAILEKLGYMLDYRYEEGNNIFSVLTENHCPIK